MHTGKNCCLCRHNMYTIQYMNHTNGSTNSIVIILLIFLFCSNALLLFMYVTHTNIPSSYNECLDSGGVIRNDIHPSLCASSNGQLFINPVVNIQNVSIQNSLLSTPMPTRPKQPSKDGCQVGGCSNELCLEASDTTTTSTCDVKPYFVCFRNAVCGRQENGRCGWNIDSILKSCLETYEK